MGEEDKCFECSNRAEMCCIGTSSLSLTDKHKVKKVALLKWSVDPAERIRQENVLTILLVTLFYKHNLKYEYVYMVILVTHTVFKVMKNGFLRSDFLTD